MHFFLMILGLGALLAGGDLLVRGASALARSLGVSTLVIGLTVVAFGTSAPELAVNLLAALRGSSDISFGNIIGSNIANTGLVIGCCALLRPLTVQGKVVSRELPMMLLASAAALVMGADVYLDGTASVFDRSDGLTLLLLFTVFLYYTVDEVLDGRKRDPFVRQAVEEQSAAKRHPVFLNSLLVAAGLFLLIAGGKITVDNAVLFAESIGVPQAVIGLTIIALGTSLPELVTSLVATLRGESDLAIGNVVGSNIFNLLFVMGVSATVRTINVPAGGNIDLLVMMFLAVLLFPISVRHGNRIVRVEGMLLLLVYCGYTAYRVMV